MEFSRVLRAAWEGRTNIQNPRRSIKIVKCLHLDTVSCSSLLWGRLASLLHRVAGGEGCPEARGLPPSVEQWLRAPGPRTLLLIMRYL